MQCNKLTHIQIINLISLKDKNDICMTCKCAFLPTNSKYAQVWVYINIYMWKKDTEMSLEIFTTSDTDIFMYSMYQCRLNNEKQCDQGWLT